MDNNLQRRAGPKDQRTVFWGQKPKFATFILRQFLHRAVTGVSQPDLPCPGRPVLGLPPLFDHALRAGEVGLCVWLVVVGVEGVGFGWPAREQFSGGGHFGGLPGWRAFALRPWAGGML